IPSTRQNPFPPRKSMLAFDPDYHCRVWSGLVVCCSSSEPSMRGAVCLEEDVE
ncbi:hypothetical protein P7K49_008925, partial [Saguinus oedipus]